MEYKYSEMLVIYLKGVAMGAADAVPGVSGGTIALITGIYQRLISAITSLTGKSVIQILSKLKHRNYSEALAQVKEMDLHFLAFLGVGIFTSLLVVLNIMHFMISQYTVQTYGFFFGLIAVSALILYSETSLSSSKNIAAAFSGFILAFLLSGYGATSLGNSLPVLFLSGSVAISAMILPGISGSLILVILGQYEFITSALSDFTQALISIGDIGLNQLIDTATPIIVFAFGAVTGLFSIANIVKKALDNHRQATMTFLVSLILGSLRAPVIEVNMHLAEQGTTWISILPEFLAASILGGIIVFLLDYKTLSDSIT